jgi:hypothetical protein
MVGPYGLLEIAAGSWLARGTIRLGPTQRKRSPQDEDKSCGIATFKYNSV